MPRLSARLRNKRNREEADETLTAALPEDVDLQCHETLSDSDAEADVVSGLQLNLIEHGPWAVMLEDTASGLVACLDGAERSLRLRNGMMLRLVAEVGTGLGYTHALVVQILDLMTFVADGYVEQGGTRRQVVAASARAQLLVRC